jgi:hypothetical protein
MVADLFSVIATPVEAEKPILKLEMASGEDLRLITHQEDEEKAGRDHITI